VEGVLWVRLPGAPRKEFPLAIFEKPASGEFTYKSWVNEAMGKLQE
jgi:hypothetical protein